MGEPLTYHSVMPICRRWERAWLDRPLWFLKNSQRMSGTGSGPEERLRGDGSISEAQKMPVAEAAERFYFPQGLAVPTPSAWPSWPAVGGEQGEGRRQGRRPPQLGQGSAPVWEADLDAVPPAEPVEHLDGGPLASGSLTPRWRRWTQAWLDRPLWVSNQAPQSWQSSSLPPSLCKVRFRGPSSSDLGEAGQGLRDSWGLLSSLFLGVWEPVRASGAFLRSRELGGWARLLVEKPGGDLMALLTAGVSRGLAKVSRPGRVAPETNSLGQLDFLARPGGSPRKTSGRPFCFISS